MRLAGDAQESVGVDLHNGFSAWTNVNIRAGPCDLLACAIKQSCGCFEIRRCGIWDSEIHSGDRAGGSIGPTGLNRFAGGVCNFYDQPQSRTLRALKIDACVKARIAASHPDSMVARACRIKDER